MPDPPPPPKQCEWEWLGVMPWELVLVECENEESCDPPAQPGTFIGESAFTDCHHGDG